MFMSKQQLAYFGEIDPDNVAKRYEAEVPYDGRMIEVVLNFDTTTVKKVKLANAEKFTNGLKKYDEKALAAIAKDFKTGDTVKDYIEHHLQELSDDELNTLLKNSDKDISTKEQMAAILHLNRISLYPESEDGFAVFDYTIDKQLTDYLVVVHFTEKGKIESIVTES